MVLPRLRGSRDDHDIGSFVRWFLAHAFNQPRPVGILDVLCLFRRFFDDYRSLDDV